MKVLKAISVMALCMILAFGLISCGGGGSSDSGSSSAASLSGDWSGSWYDRGYSGTFTASFTQSGDTLTGSVDISGSSCDLSGSVFGSVSGDTFELASVDFEGSGTFTDTSMSGEIYVTSGACQGGPGIFIATK